MRKSFWRLGRRATPLIARLWRTDPHVVRFVGDLFRRHRAAVMLAVSTVVLAAVFEGGSMGILLLALQALAGGTEEVLGSLGRLGTHVEPFIGGLTAERLFLVLVGVAVFTQLVKSGLRFAGEAITAHLRASLHGDVRDRVFRQFMTMSYAEVGSYRLGDLTSYADQSRFMGVFVRELNLIASHSGLMLAYVAVLLWMSWSMTLLAVFALGLLGLVLGRTIKRIRVAANQFTLASVSLNERTLEYLEGLRLVRAFGRVEYALERVNDSLSESVRTQRKGFILKATIPPMVQSLTILGVAGALVGSFLVLGEQTREILPRLAVFLLVIHRMVPLFGQINNSIARINDYIPVIERLARILRTEDKEYLVEGDRPFDGLERGVTFENVTLRYRGSSTPAVRDISFSLPRGKMVALVGESGAGKSTLVDLLLRFYDPTDGAIRVDGQDLRELDTQSWRDRLGIVSQDTFVFNASVRDNIAFGKLDATDEEIEAAARAAQAHDFIIRMEEGYATVVGERGLRMSGGQRQRIAIARVLLRDPDILILDEATSDLDSQSEALIQDALARLSSDRTVLAVAHRLSTVAMADEILVISDGAIVERGTHQELLAGDGRYAKLWRLQAGTTTRAKMAIGESRAG